MNANLAVAFPRNFPFDTSADIDSALQIAGVSNIVNAKMAESREINVSSAMRNLVQVGSLLQLAYAGSLGFSCRRSIAEILTNYQTLIKDSRHTSGVFVDSSLAALKLHLAALKWAENGNLKMGLKQMKRCGEQATIMAQVSKTLVDQSTALSNLSKSALLAAIDDSNASEDRKKEVQKMIDVLEASKASLTAKAAGLQEVIEESRKKEAEALKEAREARKNAFVISLVSSIAQPLISIGGSAVRAGMALSNPVSTAAAIVTGVNDLISATVNKITEEKVSVQQKYDEAKKQLAMKEADLKNSKEENKAPIEREIAGLRSQVQAMEADLQQKKDALAKAQEQLNQQSKIAQDQAAGYAKISSDLQREKIDANASLAESVVKLKNLDVNNKDLSRAIHSLELTIKTMGKVRTVFENTRLFWEGVKRRCDALTNEGVDAAIMEDFVEGEMKEDFIDSVKKSGFNWLALGKINLVAALAVEAVDKKVDGIMNDLPNASEAIKLIQNLSTTMLAEIEQERVLLEGSNNNNNNNNK